LGGASPADAKDLRPRPFATRDIVDGKTCAPIAHTLSSVGRTDLPSELALVVRLLVLKLGSGEHVLGVDDEEQVVVRLQVDVPGVLRGRNVLHRFWPRGVLHVDDAEPLREHVADVRETTVNHELDAVGTAALIGMSDESHVARQLGHRKILNCHVTYRSS
jgi:hypothetical protein